MKIKNMFVNICLIAGIAIFVYGVYSYIYKYVIHKDSATAVDISDEDMKTLSKAYKLCEEHNYQEAENVLKELVSSTGNNVYFRHELGVVLGLERKFDQAIECFDSVINESPNMILAYFNRGQAKLLAGRFVDARREYMGIKLLFPHVSKQADSAVEILERVAKEGERQIKNQLEKRVEINQKDAHALFSLGQLALKEKEYDKAEQYFSQALSYEPNVEGYQIALSNTLLEKGEYKQAALILEQAHNEKPDNQQISIALAYNYLKSNQFEKAKKIFSDVIGKNPNQVDSLIGLGLIELTHDKTDSAIGFFQKTLSVNHKNIFARNILGTCYITIGNYDAAINEFNTIIEQDKTFFAVYRNLGDAYLRKTDYEKAVEYYKKYLEYVPDDPNKKALEQFIQSYYM